MAISATDVVAPVLAASVPLGQCRLQTASMAAFESAELSTPINSRTGLSGLFSEARAIRTEQRAS